MNRKSGFTLIEVLLSVLVLGLSAAAIADVYFAGLNAMDSRIIGGQIDSAIRSRMERLLAVKFVALSSGSEAITVEGEPYTITWTVANVDLDGDTVPEPGAKQITITLGDRSLVTIVTDSSGRIGKI